MNILWISPTPSHPQDAGNRAHIHALGKRLLAAGHDITFLLYDQEGKGASQDAIAAMRAFWTSFMIIPHRLKQRKMSQATHWGIDDWFNSDIEAAVRIAKAQQQYDVVFCEYVFLSEALTLFDSNTLKILNCHDRMSDRRELLQRNDLPPDFFYTMSDQEKIALDRADLILAIQSEEKVFFETLTRKCVIELGHPIEINLLPPREIGNEVLRVGYLGSGNSLNRKSLQVFLEAYRQHPALVDKVQIVLAGSICNAIEDPDIELMGFVANEAEFFGNIDLVINPMIDGTGLKIKTLDALRHGCAILATRAASVGIPTSVPEHQCEDIESLVDALAVVAAEPEVKLPILRDATSEVMRAYQQQNAQQIAGLLRTIQSKSLKHLRRKRVLLVTDIPFWEPGYGSHSRILALCLSLLNEFDTEIFFYGSIWKERQDLIEATGLANSVISYKPYEGSAQSRTYNRSIPKIPRLAKPQPDIFGQTLAVYLDNQPKYDAIVFEYIWMAYLIDAVPYPTSRILDTHDLMAAREYRVTTQGLNASVSISLKDELAILSRFDVLLAIQSEEARWLARLLPNTLTLCCPHGVETASETPAPLRRGNAQRSSVRLGFIGGGSNENTAALEWFLQEVWPVVSALPLELHVYGNVCKKLSQPIPKKHVILHGQVDDLGKAYKQCDFMINPIMHGGGLKIKSVEALAHGKPLIASPEGAVGIERPSENGMIVACSRSQFIEATLLLARSPKMREKMGKQALAGARKQFHPLASFSALTELMGSL